MTDAEGYYLCDIDSEAEQHADKFGSKTWQFLRWHYLSLL